MKKSDLQSPQTSKSLPKDDKATGPESAPLSFGGDQKLKAETLAELVAALGHVHNALMGVVIRQFLGKYELIVPIRNSLQSVIATIRDEESPQTPRVSTRGASRTRAPKDNGAGSADRGLPHARENDNPNSETT